MVFEAAVPEFTPAVEEDRSRETILGFSLIQANLDASTQLNTLNPVQGEERPLDPAKFSQSDSQSVLTWVASQFPKHQGGGDSGLA